MDEELQRIRRRYDDPVGGLLPEEMYRDVLSLLAFIGELQREVAFLRSAAAGEVSIEILDRRTLN